MYTLAFDATIHLTESDTALVLTLSPKVADRIFTEMAHQLARKESTIAFSLLGKIDGAVTDVPVEILEKLVVHLVSLGGEDGGKEPV